MKKIIAISLLLGSAHAFAMPAVGDAATYNITVTSGTTVTQLTQKLELTALDKATNQFTLSVTISDTQGLSQTMTKQVAQTDVYTADDLTQIVNFCAQLPNGVSKKVTTTVGTFDSCELPTSGDNKGTTDIAVVPFGLVKTDYVTAKGEHVVAELSAAHAGP